MSFYTTDHVKIASAATVSSVADLRGKMLHAIQLPAAFTGVTISFQMAETPDGTFTDVYHMSTLAATKTTITSIATSIAVVVDSNLLPQGIGNCALKLVSGSSEGADRDITLFTRAL